MPNKEKVEIAALYGETEDEIPIGQCGDQVRMRLRGIEEDDISPYVSNHLAKRWKFEMTSLLSYSSILANAA